MRPGSMRRRSLGEVEQQAHRAVEAVLQVHQQAETPSSAARRRAAGATANPRRTRDSAASIITRFSAAPAAR